MKHLLLILIAIVFVHAFSYGQKLRSEMICSSDTLVVEHYLSIRKNGVRSGGITQEAYKVVQCVSRLDVGFRLEVAVSNYYYGQKTTSLIGQHGSPNFNFILAIDQLNFGLRFKPWSVRPKREIDLGEQTLPLTAQLNVIKLDFFVGYSFDFEKLFSVEPYIGYNHSAFLVINEDELNQEFDFNNPGGLIAGVTLNKYFKLGNYEYFSVFGSAGYGFVNYSKVHHEFDNGYFEWTVGVAFKAFGKKLFDKRVEEF